MPVYRGGLQRVAEKSKAEDSNYTQKEPQHHSITFMSDYSIVH